MLFRRVVYVFGEDSRLGIRHVLGAGVALAVRLSFVDNDDAEDDRTAILDTVRDHRDRLSRPMRTLFDAVVEGNPETTPNEITDGVDSDADTSSLADLERLACAKLLKILNAR